MIEVKICGINDKQSLQAAIDGGASYAGFVFYPPSPRFLTVKAAQELAAKVPAHVMSVGLFVDPSDDELFNVTRNVPFGMIQLHGKEKPERVMEIRHLTLLPVMKAIGVASAHDFAQVTAYEAVADMLLFDAKPSKNAKLPGGNAESFDWSILGNRSFAKPWLLAGGINASNLAEAVKKSGARGVDVSSGVEDRPGHKSPDKVGELLNQAKQL